MQYPIVVWYPGTKRNHMMTGWFSLEEAPDAVLLDGRNRLDAMEIAGLDYRNAPIEFRHEHGDIHDPYAYVVSANIHRRHLTTAEKADRITALLKAKPERSDRATAKIAKVSDKTVGAVRERLEATAEIPQSEKRVGTDGKARQQPKTPTHTVPSARAVGESDSPTAAAAPPPSTVLIPFAGDPLISLKNAFLRLDEKSQSTFKAWVNKQRLKEFSTRQ